MRLQSFHPTRHLPHFYRYVRVDFLSSYGSEYYCPVSILRVYGLTPMEEWKYDVWVAEWEAMYGGIPYIAATTTGSSSITDTVSVLSETSQKMETDAGTKASPAHETMSGTASQHSTSTSNVNTGGSHTPTPSPSTVDTSPKTAQPVREHTTMQTTYTDPYLQPPSNQSTKDSPLPPVVSTGYPTDFILIDTSNGTVPDSTHGSNGNHWSNDTKTKMAKVIIPTTTSVTVVPTAPGGESVYRMILNRLSNLEGNQTLYTRYVEDQARSANDRLRVLEEEVGRLGAVVSGSISLLQRPGLKIRPTDKNTTANPHEVA